MYKFFLRGFKLSFPSSKVFFCSVPDPQLHTSQTSNSVCVPIPGVTIVNDKASASRVLKILTSKSLRGYLHACDTESRHIDIKKQSPVGTGQVICASIYCGPDIDFGSGPAIWIDNMGNSEGVLELFRDYFEDDTIHKIWHNYGFDRHIIFNHDINCMGFRYDTIHMARLWDASRRFYSLAKLSEDLLSDDTVKQSMVSRFSRPKIKKDGTMSKIMEMPSPDELQNDKETRSDWILYSVGDAKATWELYNVLEKKLQNMSWGIFNGVKKTMLDFYKKWYRPFGEMLTDMERIGIHLNDIHLEQAEKNATEDQADEKKKFLQWAISQREACAYMNVGSPAQKQQLFFAPTHDKNGREILPLKREFKALNTNEYIEPGKTKPKKHIPFIIEGLGMPPLNKTAAGLPSVDKATLEKMAGNLSDSSNLVYGEAMSFFRKDGDEAGRKACTAIQSLVNYTSIDTILQTFIKPLRVHAKRSTHSRIHCSLNLNTETGRLSARRPNLQNQPSFSKDIYKIRQAFSASSGRTFIVADYGQLELRILAHVSGCSSMIDAFRQGGDFHSRTAVDMYDYIKTAIDEKKVLLEQSDTEEYSSTPLVKNVYSEERRNAKVLNFSIAYGKTINGLAKDWNISRKEAKSTFDKWYAARQEVLEWKKKTISFAKQNSFVRTIMGRYRPLPDIKSKIWSKRAYAERAAINTVVQGSASDVVMAGMLKLHHNTIFRDLQWNILLQIHDELICEGPEESVHEAFSIVKECMEKPFKKKLLVDLEVDANIANTWYEGK